MEKKLVLLQWDEYVGRFRRRILNPALQQDNPGEHHLLVGGFLGYV